MTKRLWIATAAGVVFIATSSTFACKKEETVTPVDPPPADTADEEDEPEPADEEPADVDEVEPLTKSSFDETIHDHMSEVSDCYVKLLESNPDAKGKLEADFTFAADGVPTSLVAGSGSTLTDESLVQCILEASKGWGFGPPKEEGMMLRYTFNLAPA